jgi:hypothetical protein
MTANTCSDQGNLCNASVDAEAVLLTFEWGGSLACEPDAWLRRPDPPGLS